MDSEFRYLMREAGLPSKEDFYIQVLNRINELITRYETTGVLLDPGNKPKSPKSDGLWPN